MRFCITLSIIFFFFLLLVFNNVCPFLDIVVHARTNVLTLELSYHALLGLDRPSSKPAARDNVLE